ncbi:HXXEE domain-containing protein [Kineococcus arenarius]|uniref:HXXEE domain-containing protein n=1 Tax=Kineococcus sp. SYSU DK007 TaxID=3383128 RepID=UPI003D7EEA92
MTGPDVHRALLAVFTLHNAEEVALARAAPPVDPRVLQRLGLPADAHRPDRFALAAGALTAASGAVLAAARRGGPSATGRQAAVAALTGALGGNAAAHLGRAALTRRYNAGSGTAPALLAASATVLAGTVRGGDLTARRAVVCAALGALAVVPVTAAALTLAVRVLPPGAPAPGPLPATAPGGGHGGAVRPPRGPSPHRIGESLSAR